MKIEYDPQKREKTLEERGLDFEDAPKIWGGEHFTFEDARFAYGEKRWNTIGLLEDRPVVFSWAWRGEKRRIISMRYMHEKEWQRVKRHLD